MIVKSDLIALLNEVLNESAHLRKGGNQALYHCVFCHHHKRKLEVCLEEGKDFAKWHCWTCNLGGFVWGLFKRLNVSKHYWDRLSKLTGDIRSAKHQSFDEKSEEVQLPEEFHPLMTPRNHPEYKNALAYLKRRGVIREDILRYNIGYCETGKYEHSIIIPSYDAMGKLNFFIGRRYYDTEGIISHKKPDVSMNVVGFECFVNYGDPLNICEGCFDAIAIRNNAVPLFGKYPSKKLQEAMIVNGTKRVNMILDNDAMKDAIRNCGMMKRLGIAVHLIKLDGKDPSEMGFEKIHELIRNAPEFTDDDLLKYELGM